MSTSHLSLIAVYIESSISLSECHALYMCVCVVNIFPMFLSMLIFFFFFAVLIMIAGLLIFPMGFGSTFFRHYCGDFASSYDTGHCLIGWSYMLGIMGTALSVFCPFLSQFTDMRARDIFT